MEGGSEGPSTFPVPHKEEPEAAKLSAAFKKLLSRNPMTRSALGRPQRHETSLQAAGRQRAPPGQGPRPQEHWPEPSPGHPGGFLPGDVRHPTGGGERGELCLCTREAARACALYKYLQPAFIFVI